MARAPGLDVARALAITTVLIGHSLVVLPASAKIGMLTTFIGGTGVNLSFALSGFLIGRIALKRIDTFASVALFWKRRWFRTLPASLAVAVLVALLLQSSALSFLGTVSFTRGFVRDAMQVSFLPHYWSLMVEEWFYLSLPFLLLAIGRRQGRLTFLAAAWAGLVLFHVFAASVLHLGFWQQMTLTWMRLDAIMAGVVIAAAELRFRGAVRPVVCAVSLCAIVAIFLLLLLTDGFPDYDPLLLMVTPRNWGDLAHAAEASLVPMLLALTLPAVAAWQPGRQTGLHWRLVEVTALLSYPLYLVHWDIFRALANTSAGRLHPVPTYAIALLLSTLAAVVLYLAVVRPFMIIRERVAPERRRHAESVASGFTVNGADSLLVPSISLGQLRAGRD